VAERLGVSAVKAHRLVSMANQNGAVRVSVVGDVVACIELEARLTERYGLAECRVVPDLHEEGLPLKALAATGAEFLEREIGKGQAALTGWVMAGPWRPSSMLCRGCRRQRCGSSRCWAA